jgi:O-antigen/teichoic acid export membrane protein
VSLLRKLASDTAAYGLSSIMARLINYLFSFLIVKVVSTAEYGDYTKFYAFAGFLLVVLTHGMETAFFRFRSKEGYNPRAFATAYWSMAIISVIFLLLCYLFQMPIAQAVKVEDHPEYVVFFAWILALDTLVALPFASLRANNKAIRFAVFRTINILLFIFFILLFLFWMPEWAEKEVLWAKPLLILYDPKMGIGYVFLANMLASILSFFLLIGELKQLKYGFDLSLYRKMIPYALPIMLVGFAGMINEMLSRVMMEYLLPYDAITNKEQLGIFGFNYKFAMLITLFLQAYRYAAEPYFFAQANSENARQVYAKSMHYFVIAGTFIFLGVMLFLPLIQHLLMAFDPKYANYFVGDHVVPILLGANLTLGIYFNLTTWYKVTDKTHIGAIIASIGAVITFLLNVLLIPRYGYTGAAWATLLCYLTMVSAGFIAERKYYPIPYTYLRTGFYLLLGAGLWQTYYLMAGFFRWNAGIGTIISIVFLLIFLGVSYLRERRTLPN